MATLILSGLLLLSVLVAITAPVTERLYKFLFAQLIYTIATQITLHICGTSSVEHLWTYSFFTIVILLMMLPLTLDYLRRSNVWPLVLLLATVLAAGLTGLTYYELPHPLTVKSGIYLIEGFILTQCGFSLTMSLKFLFKRDRMIALTLGAMWLALSFWRLDFVVHLASPSWRRLNLFVPYFIVFPSLTWLGLWLRWSAEPAGRTSASQHSTYSHS